MIKEFFVFFLVFVEEVSNKNVNVFWVNILKFYFRSTDGFSPSKYILKLKEEIIYFVLVEIRHLKLSFLGISIWLFISNKFNFYEFVHIAFNNLKASALGFRVDGMVSRLKLVYYYLHWQLKAVLELIYLIQVIKPI